MKLRCPKCGSVQTFDEAERGNIVRCGDCPGKFRAPERRTPPPPTRSEPGFRSADDAVHRDGDEASRMRFAQWGLGLQFVAAVAAIAVASVFFLPASFSSQHAKVAEVVAMVSNACAMIAPPVWLIGLGLCLKMPVRAKVRLAIAATLISGILALCAWRVLDWNAPLNRLIVVGACLIHLLLLWFVLFRTAVFCRFSTSRKRFQAAMWVAAVVLVGIGGAYAFGRMPAGSKLLEHVPMIVTTTFLLPTVIMSWSLQHMTRRIASERAWGRWD